MVFGLFFFLQFLFMDNRFNPNSWPSARRDPNEGVRWRFFLVQFFQLLGVGGGLSGSPSPDVHRAAPLLHRVHHGPGVVPPARHCQPPRSGPPPPPTDVQPTPQIPPGFCADFHGLCFFFPSKEKLLSLQQLHFPNLFACTFESFSWAGTKGWLQRFGITARCCFPVFRRFLKD